MQQSKPWMMKYQPGSGVTHHRPDLISHLSFVAVYLALGADWFEFMKGTFLNLSTSVFSQDAASWA